MEVGQLAEAGGQEVGGGGPPGGHPAVHEVERLHLGPAVQLCLDLLRVGVRGQLLAAAPHHQEQGVFSGLTHPELAGAQHAHLVHGGVGVHLQGLRRAAAVQLVQRHPQVVLRSAGGDG